MTDLDCPGCGRRLDGTPCDHCHYFELRDDPTRYHYCGQRSCHCWNLRGTMHPEVLAQFAEEFARRGHHD